MDRRSWLWRRKSSEKSPSAEAESSVGSLSSLSGRFSDDQALSFHNAQSPEVTSKAAQEEELSDSVKARSEKLLEALLNNRAKEDLAKQHAKVAEEAVLGWEKAETEVVALKKQVEILTQKNSVLEERISHLDGALKECLRQLRQAREEQEQKIYDVVAKKSCEWESTKSELENRLVELQSELQIATYEASMVSDLRTKLEVAEKENSVLMFQLHSISEELKLRTCERDLSTHAAEIASKQRLDCMKKVARLEAECRRLKAVARRAAPANKHRSGTASSIYVESFTDSQSDSGEGLSEIENESCKMSGLEMNDCEPTNSDSWASALIAELDQFKKEKSLGSNLMAPSVEINLMDDFLEMERLAALPEMGSESHIDLGTHVGESPFKAQLEAVINRTAELEEKLEMMEAEKLRLEMSLNDCENQLKTSRNQLEETESKMEDLKTKLVMATEARKAAEIEVEASNLQLKKSMECSKEMEANLVELQTQLATISEAKQMVEVELEAASTQKNIAESQLITIELEKRTLQSKVVSLEDEVQKERSLSDEAVTKCQKLENEVSRMELQKAVNIGKLKINQDKELAVAAYKFAECQNTIASLSRQLKSLSTVEDFLIDSERLVEEVARDGLKHPQGVVLLDHGNCTTVKKGYSEGSRIVK